MNKLFENFENNIEHFVSQEKNKINNKQHKPIRITFIDKTNKKTKKDYIIGEEADVEKIKHSNKESSKIQINSKQLVGINEKFPIDNFINFFSIQNKKEIKLQTYKYPSKLDSLKGVVYLLHGLFEHSNSNAYVAKLLSEQGYDVLCFDLRGHGNSEGIKGFFENKETLLRDYLNFLKLTESLYPDKNVDKFILGYSLGGLFANLICLERPNYFSGMILLAPPFYFNNKYPFAIKIARILNKLYPTLPVFKPKEKIEDKTIIEHINNDPLIYKGKFRLGTGLTIFDSINYSNQNLKQVNTPCYILQGRHDTIVNYKGASNFFEKISIEDKTFLLLDNVDHHFILNEKITSFISDIVFWMRVHSKF